MSRAIIRPTRLSDIQTKTYGEVKDQIKSKDMTIAGNQYTVDCPVIFGAKQRDDIGISKSEVFNRRGYIEMALPVANYFLAGKKAETFKIILDKQNAEDIANGSTIYDTSTQMEYTRANMPYDLLYTDNILVGGRYLLYLLNKLDYSREIEKMIEEHAIAAVRSPRDEEVPPQGVGHRGNGDIWVLGDYYFSPFNNESIPFFKEYFDNTRIKLMNAKSKRIVLLMAALRNPSIVHDEIQQHVIVIPIGYRPSVGRKKDPLTKAYNELVGKNNDLRRILKLKSSTCSDVQLAYKEMVTYFRNVTVEKRPNAPKNFEPLLELLQGKEGLIRDKMQGVRSDYTGRAVIIVDPYMPVNAVGIPRDMAEKLVELKIVEKFKTKKLNKSDVLSKDYKAYRLANGASLLEGKVIGIGRQPTLHRLGYRGYDVVIVDGPSIILNPLACPAYNADFDGDQMHVAVPISDEANNELATIMHTMNNLFYPRNGEPHLVPRMEILYGLWQCSRVKPNEKSAVYVMPDSFSTYNTVYDSVRKQEMNIYDTVQINGVDMTAGLVAIKACLGSAYSVYRLGVLPLTKDPSKPEQLISEGWLKEIIKVITLENKSKFAGTLNKLVWLGFDVATIFPPNINVLSFPDMSNYIEEFDNRIKAHEELFNMGMVTEESFTTFYDKQYKELEKTVKKELKHKLGEDNGYMLMVISGARGSMSNVLQLFGMKGRVMKNSDEAFNAIIKHSMVQQLTGLEHFITAYGGREGIKDKVIETYKPGYLSRKMEHTAAVLSITNEDCGTKNGLRVTYDFIMQFILGYLSENSAASNNLLVKEYVSRILVGRYIVGLPNEIRTMEDAESIYDTYVASIDSEGKLVKKEGVLLRSAITCENPCCVKCYGRDLSSNAKAIVGLPNSFIAAQSVGEPGTQLTMKNFQKGGVAGAKGLTSSFDKMENYLHLYDLQKDKNAPINYDYISPVAGEIRTISRGDGTKILQIFNQTRTGYKNVFGRKVILYEDVALKQYVERGDSIQLEQGDLSIREIMECRTVEEAQIYSTFMLYDIFKREVDVNIKHFETIIAAMTHYVCTKGNDNFNVGAYYTIKEYWSKSREGAKFELTMRGINGAPKMRNDVFSTIFMEDISAGISRSVLMSGEDSMENPLTRMAFGMPLGIGSDVPHYVERRGSMS